MTRQILRASGLGAVSCLVLAACSPDVDRTLSPRDALRDGARRTLLDDVQGYRVTPGVDTIAVGETVQLTLAGPGVGSTTQVYWHAGGPTEFVRIGTWSGAVTGTAPGVVRVTGIAQQEGYPGGTALVVVVPSTGAAPDSALGTSTPTSTPTPVPAPALTTGYAITPGVDTIAVGESVRLTFQGSGVPDSTAVYWSSNDVAKAQAGAWTGVITGVAPGQVKVTATAQMAGWPQATAVVVVTAAGTAPTTSTTTPTSPTTTTPTTTTPTTTTPTTSGTVATLPELPRATVNTTVPAPTGRILAVHAGGNLQTALDAAQPGDVVELDPGVSYVGNFILPVKSGSGWVTVRVANPAANLPAAGTRVTPRHAAQLPKILTHNAAPALATAPGTRRWHLLGLEIGALPSNMMTYALVGLGEGATLLQTSAAQLPSELVLERLYIHGHAQLKVRRCVGLNSASTAIIDSYVDECHSNNGDSQAIYGWNGPGPFKIVNNYLAASHEVLGFGGPTPGIAGLIPSDIEIRRNHITRPMSWRGVWTAKNLFEMKSGQRVLFEGNVLENNWMDAQPGYAILLQGLSDDNSAPQNRIWDVTIRRNIIRNTAAGINLASRVAYGGPLPTEPMRRVAVTQNLIVIGGSAFPGNPRMFQLLSDIRDLTISRNTVIGASGMVVAAQAVFDGSVPTERLTILDNVFGPSVDGVHGNGTNGLATTLARFAVSPVVRGNVFTAHVERLGVADNWYPLDLASAGLSSALGGDYRFAPSGSLSLAIGGQQIGVDLPALEQQTSGVVVP